MSKESTRVQCEICHRSFSGKAGLGVHVAQVHPEAREQISQRIVELAKAGTHSVVAVARTTGLSSSTVAAVLKKGCCEKAEEGE